MAGMRFTVRSARDDDRSMMVLVAEETLHPLAAGAGHPERYHAEELLEMLGRADVFVAEAEREMAGFLAVEPEGDGLAVRCVCVSPAFEARGVADLLVDWAEGLAIDRRLNCLTAYVPAGDHPSLHLYQGHDFLPATATVRPGMVLLQKSLPTRPD